MVIQLTLTLPQALKDIGFKGEQYAFPVYSSEQQQEEIIERYGQAKWAVVDILNKKQGACFKNTINLYNWLLYNENDEVAYFLNEAGSNALNYSEQKAPSIFHLWLGKRGFIIGIGQDDKGFDAKQVAETGKKENAGAAFDFFRRCKNIIFFDEPTEARLVLMCQKYTVCNRC